MCGQVPSVRCYINQVSMKNANNDFLTDWWGVGGGWVYSIFPQVCIKVYERA